jgi:hypothetical protein
MSSGTDPSLGWAQNIVADSMWQAGASIGATGLLDGAYRVNLKVDGAIDPDQRKQKLYRLDTVFGGHTTSGEHGASRPDWPQASPVHLVALGAYRRFTQRFALYSGGCEGHTPCKDPRTPFGQGDGETDIGAANLNFHRDLQAAGVAHRYCSGNGSHVWSYWRDDLADFLRFAYGVADGSRLGQCPNA